MCAKKATPSKPSKSASVKPAVAAKSAATAKTVPLDAKQAAPKTVPTKTIPTKTTSTVSAGKAAGRGLSNSDIGEVAGEVWGMLASEGPQTVAAIKKSLAAPADVVTAAIGWLAREHKLEFTTSGKTCKLALK